ncbi:glycoside hydrolase family 99-like domain-containing protein [Anaerovibrio lipolyticus]|uniref:glycoside hydrolase family 99-like domain-containing protein n=1 Tax=Anaerovibrio lipolyticus TaxID=82374 RepID=UPI000691E5FE|nr:glycoside hydrolase family 99-like domain-containing protein [Anaerovibrio lipolyticus]
MRVIAMYLPQFHRVKENDEWWGEGFTEWTAVKNAEKMFDEHEQPRVPFNKYYYDLLDKETMCWQSRLMKKYKIDGMCFYHYYFKNGRKILEQPAENLLEWTDIDMPFCFSWANESWVRSWSNLSTGDGNSWSEKYEKFSQVLNGDEGSGVLLKQEYGDECDWDIHYRYLAKFFHDGRYIKHDGMPVFMFHRPDSIPCLHQMLARWDVLAREDGFPGVYTIGSMVQDVSNLGLKGINIHEPADTMIRCFPEKYENKDNVMKSLDYQEVWEKLIDKNVPVNASLGGFVGYDDTPRRGHGGTVIRYRSPYIFYEGMKKLLLKAEKNGSPFVFINAWNEWGEGMYLEPDEKFGYGFLEAFRQARGDASRLDVKDVHNFDEEKKEFLFEENMSLRRSLDRYRSYWRVLDLWVGMLERGDTPVDYLKKQGYSSVAVYGYGMLGKHLVYQLQQEGFNVRYVIDRQVEKNTDGVPLYSLNKNLPLVDAIIVTVLYDYDSIMNDIKRVLDVDVLPVDKLLE